MSLPGGADGIAKGAAGIPTASAGEGGRVPVWDPFVRLSHWSLVAAIAVAWFTHEGDAGQTHEISGYVALGLVAARLAWGVLAPSPHARFRSFLRPPRATLAYLEDVVAGREEHPLGHNPLGAWMIVMLLFTVALVSASGWLFTTDRFWGVEWVATLHAVSSNALLLLIAVHLAGVVFTSLRSRENLLAAMVSGRKRRREAPRNGA